MPLGSLSRGCNCKLRVPLHHSRRCCRWRCGDCGPPAPFTTQHLSPPSTRHTPGRSHPPCLQCRGEQLSAPHRDGTAQALRLEQAQILACVLSSNHSSVSKLTCNLLVECVPCTNVLISHCSSARPFSQTLQRNNEGENNYLQTLQLLSRRYLCLCG